MTDTTERLQSSISVREKRLYDAWYANNVSFKLDLKIFFKTIAVVLKHENVYTNEEGNLSDKVADNTNVETPNKAREEEASKK